MTEPAARPARSGFVPAVLVGVASAGVVALASTRAWVAADPPAAEADWVMVWAATGSGAQVPVVTALALVVLAAWGVLLVTRGRFRQSVGWLLPVAAVALMIGTAWGGWTLRATWADDLAELGYGTVAVDLTAWFWIALAGCLPEVAAALAAARRAPRWPEMGRRFDAPGSGSSGSGEPPARTGDAPATNLDLWKAIDEGRDPTAGP